MNVRASANTDFRDLPTRGIRDAASAASWPQQKLCLAAMSIVWSSHQFLLSIQILQWLRCLLPLQMQNSARPTMPMIKELRGHGLQERSMYSIRAPRWARELRLCTMAQLLDPEGLLPVGEKRYHARLSYEQYHPAILHRSSRLAYLVIDHAHGMALHGGPYLAYEDADYLHKRGCGSCQLSNATSHWAYRRSVAGPSPGRKVLLTYRRGLRGPFKSSSSPPGTVGSNRRRATLRTSAACAQRACT